MTSVEQRLSFSGPTEQGVAQDLKHVVKLEEIAQYTAQQHFLATDSNRRLGLETDNTRYTCPTGGKQKKKYEEVKLKIYSGTNLIPSINIHIRICNLLQSTRTLSIMIKR